MRIDAHQHYWSIARDDYGWITPSIPVLYRDYQPSDLLPHLAEHHLDGTILVQAAPTYEETDYILELAAHDDRVLGVVGYMDLADDDHKGHFERFAQHPKFVGFRLMIQDMEDADAILEPSYAASIKHYASLGVPVDLLVRSDQLDTLVRLIEQIPDLHAVIDHLAKPRIAAGEMEPWAGYMKRLASYPNLYCKLSGMVTEADHDGWKPDQLMPYVRHVLDCFGADRVMFGSDWPVCLMASSYDGVVDALMKTLPPTWGADESLKLFGGNAAAFYRLKNEAR
ncbi:amidohydrolase family protein [Paenibacillus cineris]|uniref:amidohydrolase family protein n=1 Tax=Paenibacillus cineris TaxID=237530 RepID=UPI001AFDD9A7|nr:amidohydrolase family protein [Paenibacillus cineris]GIO60366.1 hydrolase [Paenibacillus cineris]